MKVVFENVPPAVVRVCITARDEFRLANFWTEGDAALGYGRAGAQSQQHVNYDQFIDVTGDTVTVKGQRCALWGDQHAPAMHALLNAGLVPAVYDTSDRRLAWHQTLDSYMDAVLRLWAPTLTEAQANACMTPAEYNDWRAAKRHLKRFES